MSENEYVGKKVTAFVPTALDATCEGIRPEAVRALERACAREGLSAGDITLLWHGPWAEAVVREDVADFCEQIGKPRPDLMVWIYQATACAAIKAMHAISPECAAGHQLQHAEPH